MLELTKDIFPQEVAEYSGPVVIDFWGPQCGPCLALMPEVEKLAEKYAGKIKFAKVNVAQNRRLCIELKVMGVPTFLFYKNGECQKKISGDEINAAAIEAEAKALLA